MFRLERTAPSWNNVSFRQLRTGPHSNLPFGLGRNFGLVIPPTERSNRPKESAVRRKSGEAIVFAGTSTRATLCIASRLPTVLASTFGRGYALQHKVPAGLDRKETEIYRQLDPERLPGHIAIIMDGNGRWAKRRHMPRVAGHRAGVAAVRSTVETAARIGIHALTLYAFSEENWKKRPKSEVDFLMRLLSRYLKAEVPTLNENNVRLEYIGRQHELPDDVQERMAWARASTARNSGTVLTLALNYSARSELVDAFRSMVNAASQNGGLEHLRIDEDTVGNHLYTRHLPDPDLVVRTSGEMRLSNFLLWQLAYAEIYVTPTLWPDFRGTHLLEGIAEYQKRERRYGGLNHPG
jgi:undecaprenyl diphosphate synthase